MARYELLVSLKHPRRALRLEPAHPRRSTASLTEWTARPVGRLGRPLVSEVEAYLQFFSIARGDRSADRPNRA